MKSFIASEESELLQRISLEIPEYSEELDFFFSSFDHIVAIRDGVVEMSQGGFLELYNAKAKTVEWEKKFDEYIRDQEIRLKYNYFR